MKQKKILSKNAIMSICALLMVLTVSLSLLGCENSPGGSAGSTESTAEDVIIESPKATSADLYCLEFSTFSGSYVEDGKNEKVENVAAILVENRSELFLDRATVKYKYGDKTATFLVTGLPAGEKCWVMEADKLQPDGKHTFEFDDCISAFKEDAVLATDKLLTTAKDNKVTIQNISDQSLSNVCVYYKNTADDGSFLGGITYMMNFGDLEPQESLEKESGHFSEDSKIVRYSFQE